MRWRGGGATRASARALAHPRCGTPSTPPATSTASKSAILAMLATRSSASAQSDSCPARHLKSPCRDVTRSSVPAATCITRTAGKETGATPSPCGRARPLARQESAASRGIAAGRRRPRDRKAVDSARHAAIAITPESGRASWPSDKAPAVAWEVIAPSPVPRRQRGPRQPRRHAAWRASRLCRARRPQSDRRS